MRLRLPVADRCCEPSQSSCGLPIRRRPAVQKLESLAVRGINHARPEADVVEHLLQLVPESLLFELPGMAVEMPYPPPLENVIKQPLSQFDPVLALEVLREVEGDSD